MKVCAMMNFVFRQHKFNTTRKKRQNAGTTQCQRTTKSTFDTLDKLLKSWEY